MAEERVQRRLAAILAADVVGYSRLIEADEVATRARFNEHLESVICPAMGEHRGRMVKTMGDGFLVEFGSVVDAVQCAADIQNGIVASQASQTNDSNLLFRIGIHLGDVIVEGDDIHGDGVNIAARLEGLADAGGICVSEMVYSGVRNKLSLNFNDLGEQSLKNIADPVRVFQVGLVGVGNAAKRPIRSDAISRRPAVAVLPFENLSGDPEQEYFADGLTEDIITALSLWRSFPVIARNSTFAYKGTSPDIRKVGEELGARYVVEGSVRKGGNRVRVTAQLINAETGHHIWAERYDRDLNDIFELQDELTLRVAAIIEPAIEKSEQKILSAKQPSDLSAWDLCIQGFHLIYQGTKEGNELAKEKLEQAVGLDPEYSRAWTGLAYTYSRDYRLRFTDDPQAAIRKCLEAARKAVALDESDSEARVVFARGLNLNGEGESGLAELRHAIKLNPQNSMACWTLGVFLYVREQPDEAVEWLEKALEINPLDPRNYIVKTHLANARLCADEYEGAARDAQLALSQRPDYIDARVTLAASLGYLGRREEAQDVIGEFSEKVREYVQTPHLLRRKSFIDRLETGLRAANLLD